MLKRIIFSLLMLGFLTQVLPAKADELMLNPSTSIGQAIARDEGLFLNSYTIPIVNNCMTSISFTTKQKVELFGLVVVMGALQAVYKIYRTAQKEYSTNNTAITAGQSEENLSQSF